MDHSSPSGTWLPLSFAQRSRWFACRLDPAQRGWHNNGFSARIRGTLDAAALSAALTRLAARHPMLRTRFREIDGEPEQCVTELVQIAVTEERLEARDAAGLPARVRAGFAQAFDPAQPQRLRATLYRGADPDGDVLALAFDHLAVDGWSYWRLLEELGRLLADPLAADAAPAAPTYNDYISWQRDWLAGERAEAQWRYWRERFDGAPLLQLPSDRKRTGRRAAARRSITVMLDDGEARALRALAREQGSSLFAALLAGYFILLHRHTGQDDIVVGTPLPGRSRKWENVVGDFVNPVGLRVRLGAGENTAGVLRTVRSATFGAMRHADYPFPSLVERLRPGRGADTHPLFQTMFTFQNARSDRDLATLFHADGGQAPVPWGARALAPFPAHQTGIGGHMPLALEAIELGSGIRCDLHFDPDVYDEATVRRLGAHYRRVLAGMAAEPERAVDTLDLMDAEERALVLGGFHGLPRDYGDTGLIHRLVEQRAAAAPESIALVAEGQSTSYGELNRHANAIAHRLLALGVQPDDRVALCARRGIDMVAGMLGVLKAGAAYVPLDPDYPAERLAFVLGDCAPVALLAQPDLLARLPVTAAPVLTLDTLNDAPKEGHACTCDPVVPGLASSHLAYIIYTSGSTGRPKGVMVGHRNVTRLLAATAPRFSFRADDVWSLFHSFAFDFSVWELWMPLSAGARVVIVSAACARAPDAFYALLCREGVTVLNQTPSAFRQLIAAEANSTARHRLRCIVFGGEALEPRMLAPWVERNDPAVTRLVNMYGITETTVHVSHRDIGSADVAAAAGSLIGAPIPDLTIRILDANLNPVPIGVAGEIHVGGAGLARGYFNMPDLTAQRFVRDPHDPAPDARLYRSGDLARWRADGDIEYLGRNDFQVKIRGFRIELGEIEAKLAACAGVRDAVVVARADAEGGANLVGYVVASDGAQLPVAALRDELALVLPAHMVPAAIVALDAFPLTPNGKLDRAALPQPDRSAVARTAYAPPQGEDEVAMARLWQELLGLAQVGRDDDFFDIGGHSLLATRLLARIRKAFGAEVALVDLFAQPTLAQVTRLAGRRGGVGPVAAFAPQRRDARAAVSLGQQRLWFLDQVDPQAGAAYRMPAAWRLTGRLDKAALRAALDALVARHEVLRTSFPAVDGVPVQAVAPAAPFALSEHDLSEVPAPALQAAVEAFCAAETQRPFDLAAGPLFRGALLTLSEDVHVLVLVQHHAVSDAWSVRLLFAELAALYDAFRAGRPNPLAPLALQYADFAQWQRDLLDGTLLDQQALYWQGQLAGAPVMLQLPTDRPRPARATYAGGHCTTVLAPELVRNLEALGRRHGATPFMVHVAAWGVLMARLAGQDDVVVGTPTANRRLAEWEPLIGFFVNTLALRLRLDGDPTVAQLLAQAKATALAALANQDLPFEQVVDAVNPPRSLAHAPLFQVMLTMDDTPGDAEAALAGLKMERLAPGRRSAQFDLTLALRRQGDRLHAELEYASDLFEEATARRFLRHWERLLAGMAAAVAGPDLPVSRLPLLDAADVAMLARFNDTAMPWPRERLLHQSFEAHALAHPELTALTWHAGTLSYGALNARANRIAHRIMALGVRPDDRVALCAERTPDMVAALLGILKAGAAYVPLDPAYPTERLAYMLADCAPAALLCQAATCDRVDAGTVPCIVLDADARLDGEPDHDPVAADLGPAHLAYLIYTSGSTGQPKGVMVEHRNAVAFIAWAQATFTAKQLDLTLFSTSINFDLAVFELFLPLSSGRPLALVQNVLCGNDELSGASLINTVPSAIDVLLKAGWVPSTARLVNLAGEPLRRRLVERLFADTQVDTVGNLYGPSETTTYSTYVLMPRAGGFQPHIGRPVGNTQVHILDAHQMQVPVGVVGELYIGGAGVARGYLNRPALSAERFLPDPFAAEPDARMYRTGDLGRWLADGNIEYLGRNDFQVKIRGFRIELGEIEAKLGACAGVQEAVVVAREDAQGELRLVAYAVAQPGADPAPDGLRAALAARLPGYMVPAALIVLDAWPLTPNGKLDRAALPPPDLDTRRAAPDTPHAGFEADLAALWQALLGVPLVGRDDNFFDIGGHSLLAVQLVARMREVLGIDVALADVFTHPVLAALAARAAAAAPHAGASIPVLADADAYPLSDLQTRLWLAQRLDPHGSAYNMAAVVALPPSVRFDTLARVLAVLAERHAALRTVFALRDGVPVQAILPSIKTPLEQALAADADALAAMAARHARIAFDLERGPLFAARLVHAWDGRKLLLWNMHHLVGDGRSLAVLRREMQALLAGGTPLPAASPVRHVDAGAWQSALLLGEAGGRGAVQRAFWRARLDGVPTLELPYDRPAAARTGTAGAACRLALDSDQVGRLRALAARHQATLFMVLASGFAMLLGRLSGQDDVCIGMPVAGRTHPDIQDIVGCFINTVALRQRIAPATTVAALLREVRAATLDALANQDYPFERLLEELGLERSAVVPAFLNLVPLGGDEDAAGPDAGPHRALSQDVKFDLNLYVYERSDGLVFDCHYRSACFEAATIEYVLRAYLDLLPALADADDRTCASFDLFALAPRQAPPPPALVGRARVLDADADEAESIPARFARQVALHGERVAVRTPHGALSYRQLDTASDALARVLVARAGAGEGRVALLFEHDTPMIVGLLGALKAGKTYVPLDPAYPEARLAYMLDNAQAGLLVAHGPTFELAQRLIRDHAILVVDVDADEAPDAADAALPATIAPDTPAYILYTSGSTGQPKGVVQSHRNALYFCRRYADNLRIDASDRLLLLASYSFDAAVMDVFGALLNGAALYPVDPRRTERPVLLAWMAAEAISIYHSTPTLYRHLFGAPDLRAPAALRLVVLGGEGVTAADVARFQATCGPGAVLVNGYGPTESTLALQHFIEHAAVPPANGVPAGFPVAGTGIALGAPGARPHAFQRGEIIIESAHVALGYWNDPAQTARAFGGAAARRWYRSGDIGRYRIDGSLVVEGRIDHQVKIRGFRVELGEVEAALKGCAGVRDALVVARASAAGPARLVAYLIAGEEGGSSIPAMRAHLLAQLPDYMVPGAWVTMDVFPQTPSGKLDRSALPAPDEPAAVAHSYEASHGAAEEALAAAWSALLGFDRIGRHDHFFELGGDSLLAVTLVERLRQDGWTVPVREVFARPVLADLAAAMTASVDAGPDGEVHGIPADATRLAPALAPLAELDQDDLDRVAERIDGGVANIQDVYRLAPLQEGILFHHRSQAEGDAYLLHIVLEFADRRRLDDFVGALQQVIDRHDILRSCMQWEDLPHPVQVVCRRAPLPVREAALPGAGAAALAALVDATDPHAVRLDVRRAPLLGATAGQDGEGRWMLALLAHHLVCDHVTLELVMEEVHALLDGGAAALPAALPYRRFIAGIAHEDQDAHAAYFRSRLADVDAPSAPFDVLEVRADAAAVTETRVALDDVLAARVRAAARKHQVGPAALCHLAWAAVLSRFCGRDDVVFGTVLLGRMQDLAQGQRMVGMFINALPLRVRLDGDVAPALRAVHEELAELLRHEQAPLPLALRCSGVAAPLPLFTTMFNYRHSAAGRRLAGADWQGMRVLHARERTNYPVTASVDDFHDGFELRVLAVDGVDGALLAQALHGALVALARALDQDAAAPLARLQILDEAGRASLAAVLDEARLRRERAIRLAPVAWPDTDARPQGAAEEVLAAAWRALLGLDRIGRHDHFFALGGDSMATVTLVERLRQDGWTVPVREVFARPVLADLAAAMTASVDAGPDGEVHGIPADATRLAPALAPLAELDQDDLDRVAERIDGGVANIQDVYRLAPLQEGILFHHRSQAEGDAYLLHIVLEFADRRRLDDFVGALQQVIDRHDILRSCMQWEDLPHPVQVVCRRAPLPVREAALPGAGAAALAALVDATDPHAVRLDVRRAPLLGATAGQDGEGRWMLALLAHHLVCDHVTLELVMEEVHALLDGGAAALPAALPYRRFIAGIAHEDQDAHAAYFRSRLADVDAPSAPFDVLEVRADAAAVTETRVALDDVLAARVRAAARKHQVGPAALCHLAWAAVLSRFCGRDDVVFGTVLLGRMQDLAQGQRMVGMFINALPLRVRLDGDVAPALRAVHEELAELLRHEQAPLPLALRCSGVAAPLPLFTTMFNYRHSAAGRRLAGADWQGMRVLHARERTNYPVTASVDDFHDGFELRVLAVDGVDGALLAQALHGALVALTHALDQDAAAPLAQIDIFDAAQRARLVDAVNDTRCDYEDDALMHALFERQAAARPLAPALCIDAHAISYGELNRRANLVAQRLGGMGVAPGTRVALCATRGMDMVAGLLGILKAGGAYVPLDPAHPPSRMDYMLADSAPAVVLCGAALRARFGQERPVLVLEEAITDGADPGNPCPRALGLEAGHLAYLIYTSGSTGQPKGVMIQHRPVVNLIEWVNRRFAVNHADKLLFTTSVCFDLSVYDMFGTLAAGACVRIAREDDLADPDRLLGILADEGITFWDSAPAVFGQLRPALARRGEVATSLRLAFFSGDWIALDLPDVVRRAFPRCQVVSLGGATEATVWSNYYPVAGVAPHWTSIPYGKPIANARYYVLDRHLRPCPVGVAGDLYIGGACLSAGYWNKPALSAERFVSDPFAGGDGRMYRSGDRARYWQDGNLEFLGRLDGQVKIRGYRVELSEIEACLLALDGVRDAVVLARPDGAGGSRLVAYVVADERHGPASLRGALEAALPAYMVPGAYVRLERLPLTANGKVDRAALPEPGDAAVAVRAYAAPQGAAEETLAALWRTLLALDRVGRHDHFFELGGHSLLVVRLVEGLRPLGFAAEVLDVFERPVLSDLAARLAADRPARAAGAGPDRDADEEATDWRAGLSADALAWLDGDLPGGLDNVEDAYPLAPLQEAMLVHHEMNQGAGGDAYLMRVVLEADSAARAAALLAALRTLVERHSVLRTTLRWRRLDTPLQFVLRSVHLDVAWLDLAPGDDAEAALDRASDPRTTRLALDAAPLLRVIALRQADGRCRLALLYHHAVCDHVTLEVLMEQVGNLMRDPGAALAPSRAYRHFVRRWRAQPADAQRAYFTRELGDVQTPTAPFGLRDIHGAGARVAETYREVPDPLARRIDRCARRHGASPAVLFHVAWARVLARLANRDDVVFGTVLSGRMQGDLGADRALGMFINALPLRVRLDGLDAAALVAATRRALLELIPHEQAPYALAQQCSAIPPSLPLFTALLNYRHGARGGAALEGIRTVAGYSRTNLPLSLDVDEHRGAFGIGIECVAPLRPDRVAELVLAALEALADALEAAETGRVEPFTGLPLLSAPLRRDIAAAWNAVQPAAVRPHDARPGPHGAVDARWCAGLAALGERLAVEDEAGAWTYAQLGKWVDALAGALDRAGVAPRTRVRIGLPDGRRKLGCALALLTCGCMPDPEDAAAPAMFAIAEGDVDAEGDDAPLWDHLRLRRLAAAAHDGAPRPGHAQARPAATAITLARAVDWLAQAFAPAPEQRIGVAAGLPPLRWLRDACAVLRAGATLVCAPPATTPQGLYGWLERSGVVLFSGSAAHLRLLVRARPAAARTPALRRVLIGGGALFARDVERWRTALPGAPIAHVFGDALSAYTDLCWRDDFEPLGAMYAPLGRPVPGCRVLLCAEDGEPVYPDEPGRLHLSMDADASGTTDGLARAFPDIVMCDGSLLITPAHDVFEQDMAERQGEKR